VTGKFTDFDVRLFWDEADLTASSVEATIQVASIDTGIDDRDGDLRSDNFFDAATYPTITFVSHRFERQGDSYLAHGTLTMKGVAQQIALPFQVVTRAQSDGDAWTAFTVDYTLDRTAYGITWEHSHVPFFVGDDIAVTLFVITR
jgi:polyisoprenoid-binding protein YceI